MRERFLGDARTRIVGTLALVAIAAAVMLACGSGATTTSGGSNSGGSTSTTSTSNKAAKVGDTITINGESATLVSVQQIQPGQYDTPPSTGKAYYVLHLKMTNSGSSPADFNEFDFKVLTGQGSTIDQSFISSEPDDKLLQSGQIAPGGNVEGDLVYQLSTSDHGAKLIWQPGFDNSLDHAWSLGI